TPQSGVDANRNGDTVDRTIVNPAGTFNVGSDVTALCSGGPCSQYTGAALAQHTVAYVAKNSNARYIRAQAGALANAGRNTLHMPGINNFDLSLAKRFN